MTCARCDSPARQLAEAKDELEAYRHYERDLPPVSDEYVAFRRVLGITGAPARILETLLAKPGAVLTMTAAGRLASGLRDVSSNVAQVQICRLRKALRPHGVTVKTMSGAGYCVTPDDAAKIKALAT